MMFEHPILTIFAVPKRFDRHFGVIQRNAIRSWARLEPRRRSSCSGLTTVPPRWPPRSARATCRRRQQWLGLSPFAKEKSRVSA
jgi:hypothetical protein